MSLKKIALIALIVVMLLGSVIAFGCKPKTEAAPVDSTMTVDTTAAVAPVDTTVAPTTETPATTPAKK